MQYKVIKKSKLGENGEREKARSKTMKHKQRWLNIKNIDYEFHYFILAVI